MRQVNSPITSPVPGHLRLQTAADGIAANYAASVDQEQGVICTTREGFL